jgi:ParB/RepB/Spo0J family partition protein
MAVKWSVKATSNNVFLFDPAHIKIKEDLNGRAELPDIEELKASILQHGQLQPVAVRNEAGVPVLVMGFSRWRAICAINEGRPEDKRLKIAAVTLRCNEVDGFIRNWEENRKRNQTTPLDDAHHFAQLERWGWDKKKIAEELKISPKLVTQRLALIEAEPEVQTALKTGRIKTNAAVKLAKLSSEEQRKVVNGNGKVSDVAIATATNTTIKPNLRNVKEFIEIRMVQAGQTDSVRKFGQELLDYMEGKAAHSAAR